MMKHKKIVHNFHENREFWSKIGLKGNLNFCAKCFDKKKIVKLEGVEHCFAEMLTNFHEFFRLLWLLSLLWHFEIFCKWVNFYSKLVGTPWMLALKWFEFSCQTYFDLFRFLIRIGNSVMTIDQECRILSPQKINIADFSLVTTHWGSKVHSGWPKVSKRFSKPEKRREA